MGYIFGSGIGFAALTAVLASSTAATAAGASASDLANLHIQVEKLRNVRGVVRACLTRERASFPNCASDPNAVKLSVAAEQAHLVSFEGLPVGTYALSIIHDENANGRLDTFAKIPREGFGFSRNPPIRFGAPKFSEALFTVAAGANRQTVQIRYLL
jgi:uncharacterized protein (DUF2141 family)